VLVRRAVAADAPALAALRLAWGREHGAGDEAFAALFEEWVRGSGETHTGFVATVGDAIVGMAWLARLPRTPSPERGPRLHGDVQSVYVLPSHRGHGTGTALTNAVIEEARAAGVQRLTVQSSTRAVTLYESLGFASSPKLLWLDL
jgi:GNAT superfamily N-acetyltransferase